MKGTGISWAHNTENFWRGCWKVDDACGMCYDALFIPRIINPETGERDMKPFGEVYLSSINVWSDPWVWQRAMEKTGEAQRVFTCSLSDFFLAKIDKMKMPEASDCTPGSPPALAHGT